MSLGRWLILFLSLITIVTSILTGCQTHIDPKTAGATAVAAATGQDYLMTLKDNVPLYVFGPQQLGVPDEFLKKDDLVRVIKSQLGFTLVETSGGQVGWVPTEDLSTAPAQTLLAAGLAYEAPSPYAKSNPKGLRSRTRKSNYPAEPDTAIVKRYTLPDSDTDSEPTPSPSVHP